MTYSDTWIQTASGEAVWFPPEDRQYLSLSLIQDGVRSGRFRGEQVDALTWRATMTLTELKDLLYEIYGPPGAYENHHDTGLRHLADKMRRLRSFIVSLPPDAEITVTADEF